MRIGIDARPLTAKTFAGISYYEYQLVCHWMKQHPEHEYFLMARKDTCFSDTDLPENWHIVNTPWVIDEGKLWFLFKLPALIKEHRLDAFWGPNYSLPRKVKGVAYFLTVHDLALFKFKGIGEWKNAARIKLFLRRVLAKAEKIFAISVSTKRDLHELFHVPDEKVNVTYLSGGDEQSPYTENAAGQFRDEIGKLRSVFLFVGTIEPRKNIETIIRGYEEYAKETEDPLPLVLAGGRGWNCDGIYRMAENSPFREKILMTGYVTDAEKEALFQKAKAFLYPSLYEGFGIPVLEAFSRGVPVITANNSSLPEVGGDAAFYMDTYDTAALKEYLKKTAAMSAEELNDLRKRMEKQREKFSWEKCAEETLKLITE